MSPARQTAPRVVNVARFGAVGDGWTDDTAALQAAADAAFAPEFVRARGLLGGSTWIEATPTEAAIYLPAGTYVVAANNGTVTGWKLNLTAGQRLRVYGDGDATVVKRAATETLASSSALVWLAAVDACEYTFETMLFDGNEANCPYDPEDVWAHEQSANVRTLGAGAIKSITMTNVAMTGCVADGLMVATPVEELRVEDFRAYGRTRRVRADVQLSRVPLVSTVCRNLEVDAFEFEPSNTNTTHTIELENITCRGALDVAGDTEFVNVTAHNVTSLATPGVGLPFTNFYKVRGTFTNCVFHDVKRIQRCEVQFNASDFHVRAGNTPGTANAIEIWQDRAASTVLFDGCGFHADDGLTAGRYMLGASANNDETRVVTLRGCTVETPLDFVVAWDRVGKLVLDGGTLRAESAVASISHGGGESLTWAVISSTGDWDGAPYALGITGGRTIVDVDGVRVVDVPA